MRADIHQHLWTRPLLDALMTRTRLPYVRRSNGLTMLHAAGERAYVIDVAAEAPENRSALVAQDGLDVAVIALSSPIGIEALHRDDALELIDAHLAGIDDAGFEAWGPVPLDRPDADDVDAVLARGCIGVSIPAGALAEPWRRALVEPILVRAEELGAPVFVHPGPAPGRPAAEASLNEPLWWAALTDYVAQMQAAWLTFVTFVRQAHPGVVAVFAMLAGGAPLLSERLKARGGPPFDLRDPRVFYDTSSYGPSAVEAMARLVGRDRLLYGSDRPVIEPSVLEPAAGLKENAGGFVAGHALAARASAVKRTRGAVLA